MKTIKLKLLITLITLSLISCVDKNGAGEGGNTTLIINPNHHGYNIKNAKVYIKYNTRSKPSGIGEYNKVIIADQLRNGKYVAILNGLKEGNYYLYGDGFDNQIQLPVTGGKPYTIRKASGEIEIGLEIVE